MGRQGAVDETRQGAVPLFDRAGVDISEVSNTFDPGEQLFRQGWYRRFGSKMVTLYCLKQWPILTTFHRGQPHHYNT